MPHHSHDAQLDPARPADTLLSHIELDNKIFESQRQLVDALTLEQTMEAMSRATMHAIGNMDID